MQCSKTRMLTKTSGKTFEPVVGCTLVRVFCIVIAHYVYYYDR